MKFSIVKGKSVHIKKNLSYQLSGQKIEAMRENCMKTSGHLSGAIPKT